MPFYNWRVFNITPPVSSNIYESYNMIFIVWSELNLQDGWFQYVLRLDLFRRKEITRILSVPLYPRNIYTPWKYKIQWGPLKSARGTWPCKTSVMCFFNPRNIKRHLCSVWVQRYLISTTSIGNQTKKKRNIKSFIS